MILLIPISFCIKRVLRYEDLSLNVSEVGKSILQFLNIKKNKNFERFLASHTVTDAAKVHGTIRDSKR